jgi:hypothetical protein
VRVSRPDDMPGREKDLSEFRNATLRWSPYDKRARLLV